jgi:sialate O-acetylesterase
MNPKLNMSKTLLSDGMVLQRGVGTRVCGRAAAGQKVTINFNGKTHTATADADGKWVVILSELKAGGPYNMEVNAGNNRTIKDILIGDVWVCSGQSNMELPMERVKYRYADIIANSENPAIRHFAVPLRYDFTTPQEELESGNWESANPESVLNFSAAGYFFAKALFEKYHVPIGLISTAVGGSPAEAWLSEDALKAFPDHLKTAEKFKDSAYLARIEKEDIEISNEWYNRVHQQDKGLANGKKQWFDTSYDASEWSTMNLPAYWDEEGLAPMNGVVWFRREFDIPASMAGKSAKLWLGRIVDNDTAYINGTFVGTTGYQYPPRIYDVPENLLKAGRNVIVIRVINTADRGGFIKDKPYQLNVAEHTIDLKGKWQYKVGTVTDPLPAPTYFQYQPLGLFNGMIAPILDYTIKGVIWYQGESNVGRAREYQKMFPALIADWRQKWKQGDFPFLFVQLANYLEADKQPSEGGWAELREAQLKTLSVPNTAMAVTIDTGEWNDPHPLNKKDIGERLALAAQKVAYGDKNVVHSGPIYQSMKIEGNKIIISFINIGGGLVIKGGGELRHFAIAGVDKKFVWAKAKIQDNKIIVWNDQVTNPVAVRYAWADNPEGANLYNKEGLPASPFRTD